MIAITVECIGADKRGLLWNAAATYADQRFVVNGVYQPERDVLRAVIDGTPDFVDCPWRLVRNGRADFSGPSARWMAARTVKEGPEGTVLRLDDPVVAAIYRSSHVAGI